MKKFLCLLITSISLYANAQTIAAWKFNSVPADGNSSTGTLLPFVGSGSIVNVGAISNIFFDGVGSSDPDADNTAYSTFNYPAETDADKSSGIEIAVSTSGHSGIFLRFDMRCFPSAANEYVIQYSTDGIGFNDFQTLSVSPANAGVFVNNNIINFSSVTALNNNPNAKFRIVSSFEGNGTNYVAVNNPGEAYNSASTVKFDMLSVSASSILPVTVSDFTGFYANKTSVLKWTAANEINMRKYIVERSEDGRVFTEIGFVNATGSTEYSYPDVTSKTSINFYRLKIAGINETKYSAIIKIASEVVAAKLNIYPSPAVNAVNAEFISQQKRIANVQMTNSGGRVVFQKNIQVQQGYNNLVFEINNFSKGMYNLKITMGTNIVSSSFNKL